MTKKQKKTEGFSLDNQGLIAQVCEIAVLIWGGLVVLLFVPIFFQVFWVFFSYVDDLFGELFIYGILFPFLVAPTLYTWYWRKQKNKLKQEEINLREFHVTIYEKWFGMSVFFLICSMPFVAIFIVFFTVDWIEEGDFTHELIDLPFWGEVGSFNFWIPFLVAFYLMTVLFFVYIIRTERQLSRLLNGN